jgi:hypothetical protein
MSGVNFKKIRALMLQLKADQAQAAVGLLSLAKPVTALSRKGVSAAAARTVIPCYVLPANFSASHHYGFAMYLLACCCSVSSSLLSIKSLLYTIFMLLYPSLLDEAEGREYAKVYLPPDVLILLDNFWSPTPKHGGDSEDEMVWRFVQSGLSRHCPALPDDGMVAIKMTYGDRNWLPVYAQVGILCFALTKDVTATGEMALTVRRPSAILAKYRINSNDYPYIAGDASTSDWVYEQCYQAWRELPYLRRIMFRYFAPMIANESASEDEALFTTIRLMAWGESSHIALILAFLSANTLAYQYPKAQPHIAKFTREFEGLLGLCPPILDKGGQPIRTPSGKPEVDLAYLPYVKIIHMDKITVVLRHEHSYLLDLAVQILKLTDTRLGRYVAPDLYPTAGADYLDFVREYEEYDEEMNRLEASSLPEGAPSVVG